MNAAFAGNYKSKGCASWHIDDGVLYIKLIEKLMAYDHSKLIISLLGGSEIEVKLNNVKRLAGWGNLLPQPFFL